MIDTACSFSSTLAERLKSEDLDLPVLPQIATQVLAMVDDENADATRLSALVQGDPALATRLLSTANTMAYGARTEIVSLQQSVARLGMNGVKEVVIAVCVKDSVYALPGREDTMEKAWRQSLASAGFGKEIARVLRLNVEQAYLCGLLHEVGRPVALIELSKTEKRLDAKATPAETEALLSEFTVPCGVLIASKWGLPGAVRAAIEFFQDHALAAEHQTQVTIAALADRLARQALSEDPMEDEELRTHSSVADLNLYPEDLDAVLEQSSSILERVEALAS